MDLTMNDTRGIPQQLRGGVIGLSKDQSRTLGNQWLNPLVEPRKVMDRESQFICFQYGNPVENRSDENPKTLSYFFANADDHKARWKTDPELSGHCH